MLKKLPCYLSCSCQGHCSWDVGSSTSIWLQHQLLVGLPDRPAHAPSQLQQQQVTPWKTEHHLDGPYVPSSRFLMILNLSLLFPQFQGWQLFTVIISVFHFCFQPINTCVMNSQDIPFSWLEPDLHSKAWWMLRFYREREVEEPGYIERSMFSTCWISEALNLWCPIGQPLGYDQCD